MRKRHFLEAAVVTAVAVLAASVGIFAYAQGTSKDPDTDTTPVAVDNAPADPEVEETPEYVPVNQPTVDHSCGETGKNQLEVEQILSIIGDYGPIFVDGDQSVEDCDAIKKFQKRFGIWPDDGHAGELTLNVATRLRDTSFTECDTKKDELVVCIDLTHQTLWVADGDTIVHGPTVVRTGMAGYATQTGKLPITNKAEMEWSKPYKVWLPSWQHFYMGQGLHETTTYIHDAWNGSHGCVNLLHDDAVTLYEMVGVGTVLHIFGHRAGT